MIRTQIQLTEEQAEALKRIASSRRVSVAEAIREAVDTMIRATTTIDMEERRKRARAIAGKYRSGKEDISAKHDEYLSESVRK
ncbi:MAG TPA: ribbon-helix-helix protein, CopG family [Dissulfurispiraceae bacterium]|nr:ribbon-helix-helix protein, CopG family [Dissulfurispiraceae bacterium]